MTSVSRRLSPYIIRALYSAIREGKGLPYKSYSKVIQTLSDFGVDKNDAEKYMYYAIEEHVVIRETENNNLIVKIPDLKEVEPPGEHDVYCFECHKPHKLHNCRSCFRAFHLKCVRRNADQQFSEWPLPLSKLPVDIVLFHLEEGVVVDANDYNGLCTACRLVVKSPRRDGNLNSNEITKYLMDTFDYIKSWISLDTYSPYLNSKSIPIPTVDLPVFEKMCLRNPITLDTIKKKFLSYAYRTLTEYYIDILSVQHNVGILYGTKSKGYEYSGSEYLVLDSYYAICEVRQCKTCFANSARPQKDWFCQPCEPKHDLVYAKQRGYGFWPAKVMEKKGDKYDVRFFGKSNTRAIVHGMDLRPIESDLKQLNVRSSQSFRIAMDQLRIYQKLVETGVHPALIASSNNNNNCIYKNKNCVKGKRKAAVTTVVRRKSDGQKISPTKLVVQRRQSAVVPMVQVQKVDEVNGISTAPAVKNNLSPTAIVKPCRNRALSISGSEMCLVENFRRILEAGNTIEQVKDLAIQAYEMDISRLRARYNTLREYTKLLRNRNSESSPT